MDLLSSVSQGNRNARTALSWFLSSDIRPSGGLASGRRLLLYGLYKSALDRNRVAFLVTTQAEALAALERTRPGLLILTPRLDDGDGLSLVTQARSVVHDIRTIVICDRDVDDLATAAESGADAVVCEQEFLSDSPPLPSLMIALSMGRRYLSPLVLEAQQERQSIASNWRDLPPPLTTREQELIDLWVGGLGDREAAEQLGVSYATIRSYGRSLRKKLGVGSRGQAVLKVINLGLTRVSGR